MSIVDLSYVDEHREYGGGQLAVSYPQRGDLCQARPLVLGEALQVHQDLVHLLLVHLLQILKSEKCVKNHLKSIRKNTKIRKNAMLVQKSGL